MAHELTKHAMLIELLRESGLVATWYEKEEDVEEHWELTPRDIEGPSLDTGEIDDDVLGALYSWLDFGRGEPAHMATWEALRFLESTIALDVCAIADSLGRLIDYELIGTREGDDVEGEHREFIALTERGALEVESWESSELKEAQ